jgi:hypothetical protein
MQEHSKEKLLGAYNRLVKEHGGELIGERIFKRETGFSHHYWKGGYWRSWSAFQIDAGHEPNSQTEKISDDIVLNRFAQLALEMNAVPSEADLMLKRNDDPSFPSKAVYRRWGSRDALLAKVADYCESEVQFAPVLDLLRRGVTSRMDSRLEAGQINGFVYLLRSGKNYKLGRTNAVGRRLRELAIQLPQKPDTVHVIETDDPEGIEQYWHRRFANKRQGGEWFSLTTDDVKAFKRRRFQ